MLFDRTLAVTPLYNTSLYVRDESQGERDKTTHKSRRRILPHSTDMAWLHNDSQWADIFGVEKPAGPAPPLSTGYATDNERGISFFPRLGTLSLLSVLLSHLDFPSAENALLMPWCGVQCCREAM
jgi:hypothetical protein